MAILWVVLYFVVGYVAIAVRSYFDARAGDYFDVRDVMVWLLWLVWPLALVALYLENTKPWNPFAWVVRLAKEAKKRKMGTII